MSLESIEWVVARGAGMSAFVLLSVAVALGLALSLRASSPAWPRLLTTDLHRSVTVLALWMTALHLGMLLVDAQADIAVVDLVVPFATDYRPLATALGVLALDVLVVTWVSTLMRARLGQRRWRALHRIAIVAYIAALGHGVLAGTDRGTPWAVFVFVASDLGVGMLLLARILRSRTTSATPPPTPPPASGAGGGGLPPLTPRPARAGEGLPPLAR